MSVSRKAQLGLVGLLVCVIGGQATHENRAAFAVLCNLIALTEENVGLPASASTPEDIRQDLIKLNMTTAEDAWFNLFDGSENAKWTEAKEKEPFKTWIQSSRTSDPDWEARFTAWNHAKKEILSDAEKDDKKEFERPPAGNRRQIAHAKILQIWKRFIEIEEKERKPLKPALIRKVAEIKAAFDVARTGLVDRDGKVDSTDSFDNNNNRATACGATGNQKTGRSLANDITCLCSSSDGSNVDQICATDLRNVQWASADPKAAYTQIYEKCKSEIEESLNATPQNVQKLLRNFSTLLGKNIGATSAHVYVLGGGGSGGVSNDCQGNGANTVCVNYKANLHGATAAGIPWVNSLEQASRMLEGLAVEEKKLSALNAREEVLREAAWAAYGEAKLPDAKTTAAASTMYQAGTDDAGETPNKTAAVVTKADTESKEATATISRLILPWILLI